MAKAQYKKWFSEAIYDLKIFRATYDWPDRSLLRCGFFLQQSIEKSIKGYLVYHGLKYPTIHDLGKLADLAIKNDGTLSQLFEGVEELNPFYLAARYPDAANEEDFKNIESKIENYSKKAQAIFDVLLSHCN